MDVVVTSEYGGEQSVFVHCRGLLNQREALYDELLHIPDAEWIQGRFMQHLIPRLVRWHDQEGQPYKFAGRNWASMPYTPHLRKLQADLPGLLAEAGLPASIDGVPLNLHRLNSVLVNKYRDHTDSISAHADNEPVFGRHPTIVSVNLGAPRTFRLKRMTRSQWEKEHKGQTYTAPPAGSKAAFEYRLQHGDVLIMAGAAQEHWYHRIDKEASPETFHRYQKMPGRARLQKMTESTVRFNLTFRPYEKRRGDQRSSPQGYHKG